MSSDSSVRDSLFALECLPRLTDQKFKDFSREDSGMYLDEAKKLATEVLVPLNKVSDREGARFHPKTGKVTTPKGFRDAFLKYTAAGWGTSSLAQEYGGVGMPESLSAACGELFIGACSAFSMVHGLTRSAIDVITTFGSDAQKMAYLPNLVSGKWTGTMCLTESMAGSDVGALTTKATPIPGKDGCWAITGTKIFISFGEHDLAENIIHLVLARTPGAPNGTKGISLFIVPKMKIGHCGNLTGKKNNVVCGGIEHKMGIHGSPTAVLNFGEKGECVGELIGEVNRGMQYMFVMMNEARLLVGLQGEALAAAAYDAALAYAKDRVQSVDNRELGKPAATAVPIVKHHDVRRMLFTMKAYTEGMRALVYHVAHYLDMSRSAGSDEERRKYHRWVELLTPVVKAYCTDIGFEVTNIGVQVHGGVGYCGDYPAEQYMRDARITPIYEGTNGIQALDLFKKISRDGGKAVVSFAGEMRDIENLKEHPVVGPIAVAIERRLESFAETLFGFQDRKMLDIALVNASRVLTIFGTIVSAYHLLKQAVVASKRLSAVYGDATDETLRAKIRRENSEARFYFGKIVTARFFAEHLLPQVDAGIAVINGKDTSCMEDVL